MSLLRRATLSDLDITFAWANNPVVRKYSFNTQQIIRAEHESWFSHKVKDANTVFYILEREDIPLGSIRFDLEKEAAKINYLIDPLHQGQGLGTYILEKGLAKLREERPNVTQVYGWVLSENLASVRIFQKLSFVKILEQDNLFKFAIDIGHEDR